MDKKIDYIIVGHGIAGSVLAHTLIKSGFRILIINDSSLSKASKVAAGLYNPVVFKRLSKSWMVDELLPFMDNFYPEMEDVLGTKFYHKKEIIKIFSEENEKHLWLKKSKEDVGAYLSKEISENFISELIDAPLGIAETLHAGHLDINLFISLSEKYFIEKKILLNEKCDYNQIQINDADVSYKNILAKKIIFCEGYKTLQNPFFSWLPFKLTKGEVITIEIENKHASQINKVINKGVFILPIGNNQFKVGATYEWDNLTEEITQKGKDELTEKLNKVLKVPYKIIKHEAGIRPTVIDRRPLLGLHPKHNTLAIFNGLGTKGVMLAPYFANHFAEFLAGKTLLNSEVMIDRIK